MKNSIILLISAVALVIIVAIFGTIQGWWPIGGEDNSEPEDIYIIDQSSNNNNNNNQNQYMPPITVGGQNVPVEQLNLVSKDKFTMAASTDGDIKFYEPGANVEDPYVLALDNLDFSAGKTSNKTIQTNTPYDVYYQSDGATNYDEYITGWQINYNPETGKGYLLIGGNSYYAVTPVGAFPAVDTLPEVQTGIAQDGNSSDMNNVTLLNNTAVSFADTSYPASDSCAVKNVLNATNYSETVPTANYTISGCTITYIGPKKHWNNTVVTVNYTKTTSNLIKYDESSLSGSGWFQQDIGNDNANSELRDVVYCFRDDDGDMEGNEVTAFTASYVSGSTAISIPGSLQQYWEDAMGGGGAQCVKIADMLGGSQKARWQFTMTVAEANFDTSEEFEISLDDVGKYLAKQYPSRNVKATAKTLYVGDQA